MRQPKPAHEKRRLRLSPNKLSRYTLKYAERSMHFYHNKNAHFRKAILSLFGTIIIHPLRVKVNKGDAFPETFPKFRNTAADFLL